MSTALHANSPAGTSRQMPFCPSCTTSRVLPNAKVRITAPTRGHVHRADGVSRGCKIARRSRLRAILCGRPHNLYVASGVMWRWRCGASQEEVRNPHNSHQGLWLREVLHRLIGKPSPLGSLWLAVNQACTQRHYFRFVQAKSRSENGGQTNKNPSTADLYGRPPR